MEKNPKSNNDNNKYSSHIKKINSKKSRSSNLIKKNIRKQNSTIFTFLHSSSFIFEARRAKIELSKLIDKNSIKPSSIDLEFLKNHINTINQYNSDDNIISVLPLFSLIMDNVQKVNATLDRKSLLIQDIINKNREAGHISIRKITEKYNNICTAHNLNKISKSQTHRIIRKVLKYSYRKTKIKNNKLLNSISLVYSYFFLKVFIRAISLGLEPIFLDESGFYSENNNFYTWRKQDDEIYCKIDDKKRLNLIMAVGINKIYHFELNQNNTNNIVFKNFMINLINNMNENEKNNSIIILDNLSCHLTSDLFQLYHENSLKLLFNVPYKSPWNMIEIVFHFIKNITYKKLYANINILENDIVQIIKSGEIEKALPSLYKETLNKYLKFIKDNKDVNLNILNI